MLREIDTDDYEFELSKEENDSLGMLHTPSISYFGFRSPGPLKSSFDSSTSAINGSYSYGGANPALSEKSMSLSNVDAYHNSPPSPSDHPMGQYLSNGHGKHHWRLSPIRASSFLPNGVIPRQQTTIDESVNIDEDGQEASTINGADTSLKPTENGVGLILLSFFNFFLKERSLFLILLDPF